MMTPLLGAGLSAIDALGWLFFFGIASCYYIKKTDWGSCWAITLTCIGWLWFAKGTVDVCQILENGAASSSLNADFLFYAIYHRFGVGLCFLFAAYILRSLEDALAHFKAQSAGACKYYGDMITKHDQSHQPDIIKRQKLLKQRGSPSVRATTLEYFLHGDGQQRGPYDEATLRTMLADQQVLPTDLIWNEQMPDWATVKSILS